MCEPDGLLQKWLRGTNVSTHFLTPAEMCDCNEDGEKPVRVRVHVRNIQNVDTVQQRFDCTLWVQFRWRIGSNPASVGWFPNITVLDTVGEARVDTSKYVEYKDAKSMYGFVRYVVHATFAERFELHDFPWDMQRLHFRFQFYKTHCTLTRDGVTVGFPGRVRLFQGVNLIYREAFVQEDAWSLRPELVLLQGRTPAERDGHGIQHLLLGGYMTLVRRPAFYLWNIVLPVNVLVLLSFSTYAMEELADRTSVTLTLLLTLVAFKLGINGYLPTTSYLTLLDKYLIASFLYLAWVYVSNMALWWDRQAHAGADVGVACATGGVWFVGNLACGAWVYRRFYGVQRRGASAKKDVAEVYYDRVIDGA